MTYQSDHVAILSYEYWQNHYNADANVLGKTIRRDGIDAVVVGVLPAHFHFLSFTAPVYVPLSSEESERNVAARHTAGALEIARLAPGATLAEAQAQGDAQDAAHAAEFPDAKIVTDSGYRAVVAPLHADHVGSVRPTVLLLQASALFLLVIGGGNLANLLLIRARFRSRDVAIRQALGANQHHVVHEVMTETVFLTLLASVAALACLFPACRATKVNPMVALRAE